MRLNRTGSRSAALLRRLGAGRHHLGEALAVVLVQLADARVQAAERLAVRGQDQRVLGQPACVDRVEEQRQRVGLRLDVDRR